MGKTKFCKYLSISSTSRNESLQKISIDKITICQLIPREQSAFTPSNSYRCDTKTATNVCQWLFIIRFNNRHQYQFIDKKEGLYGILRVLCWRYYNV